MLLVSNLTSAFVHPGNLYHGPIICQKQTRHCCELDMHARAPGGLDPWVPDWLVPGPSTQPLILYEISVLPPQSHFPSCDLGEASAELQLQGVHSSPTHLAKPSADVVGRLLRQHELEEPWPLLSEGAIREECRVQSWALLERAYKWGPHKFLWSSLF